MIPALTIVNLARGVVIALLLIAAVVVSQGIGDAAGHGIHEWQVRS